MQNNSNITTGRITNLYFFMHEDLEGAEIQYFKIVCENIDSRSKYCMHWHCE